MRVQARGLHTTTNLTNYWMQAQAAAASGLHHPDHLFQLEEAHGTVQLLGSPAQASTSTGTLFTPLAMV